MASAARAICSRRSQTDLCRLYPRPMDGGRLNSSRPAECTGRKHLHAERGGRLRYRTERSRQIAAKHEISGVGGLEKVALQLPSNTKV